MNESDPLMEMSRVLSETNDSNLIYDFLQSLLTEYEVEEIGSRWKLVRLLDEGMSQRNIARALGLSLCKITRGSKELKKDDSPFGKMIEKAKTF